MKIREIAGVQPLIDTLSLCLQSTYVVNEQNAISLLIVANAESAKTTVLYRFSNLDFVSYYDDITQKKLLDEFIPFVRAKQKRTLAIPDLINSVEKQKVTRAGFLNIIKSAMDDTGLTAISTPHLQLQRALENDVSLGGTKFNVITAVTKGALMEGGKDTPSMKKIMVKSGLLSRFLPFSYEYSISLVKKIFDLQSGKDLDDKDYCEIPELNKTPTIVECDYEYGIQLDILATMLNNEFDKSGYGIRPHRNLIRLVKANALINGRDKVTKSDIDRVMDLSKYFNFKFTSMG